MFSILIPTWNNLELLKLCVHSIRENSGYSHQIIVQGLYAGTPEISVAPSNFSLQAA